MSSECLRKNFARDTELRRSRPSRPISAYAWSSPSRRTAPRQGLDSITHKQVQTFTRTCTLPCSRSLYLEAGEFHHFLPLLGFGDDFGAKRFRGLDPRL